MFPGKPILLILIFFQSVYLFSQEKIFDASIGRLNNKLVRTTIVKDAENKNFLVTLCDRENSGRFIIFPDKLNDTILLPAATRFLYKNSYLGGVAIENHLTKILNDQSKFLYQENLCTC